MRDKLEEEELGEVIVEYVLVVVLLELQVLVILVEQPVEVFVMEQQELQQSIMEFEKNRNQLMNIGSQKQQLQLQSSALGAGLEELGKTKEKKAYKAVANILVLCDVEDLKKELSEQKESSDLRVKTLQKQEDSLIERLNKLKSSIEKSAMQAQAGASPQAQPSGEETKITNDSKNSKGKK